MRLPEFVIIGGQRCGSSACAKNLEKHPDIGIARWEWYDQMMPEFHYFDLHFDKGPEWYGSKFDGMTQKLVGEKTPEYFHRGICHRRMAHVLPDAKLVLLLRNPVDRLYSAFNYARQHQGGHIWFGPTYLHRGLAAGFETLLAQNHESRRGAITSIRSSRCFSTSGPTRFTSRSASGSGATWCLDTIAFLNSWASTRSPTLDTSAITTPSNTMNPCRTPPAKSSVRRMPTRTTGCVAFFRTRSANGFENHHMHHARLRGYVPPVSAAEGDEV